MTHPIAKSPGQFGRLLDSTGGVTVRTHLIDHLGTYWLFGQFGRLFPSFLQEKKKEERCKGPSEPSATLASGCAAPYLLNTWTHIGRIEF